MVVYQSTRIWPSAVRWGWMGCEGMGAKALVVGVLVTVAAAAVAKAFSRSARVWARERVSRVVVRERGLRVGFVVVFSIPVWWLKPEWEVSIRSKAGRSALGI